MLEVLPPSENAVTFRPQNSDVDMTWEESLFANYTDGIVILHKGKIVYEKYLGCLSETGKHAAMSMTKSLTGLLAEILVAEGQLDDKALVSSIVPELKSSAFGSATVRQVMDMTTALDYSEDYADPKADIWVYSAAANPLPKASDYRGPNGYFEYLQTVRKDGSHGESFGYKTVNTDALGWIISRASGKELTELLSEKIWSRMGAEQDAYMTVDGQPFEAGQSFALGTQLRGAAADGSLTIKVPPEKLSEILKSLEPGQTVLASPEADILPGNALPMSSIPLGTTLHNIELRPGKGGQMMRSAGASAQLAAREGRERLEHRRHAGLGRRSWGERRHGDEDRHEDMVVSADIEQRPHHVVLDALDVGRQQPRALAARLDGGRRPHQALDRRGYLGHVVHQGVASRVPGARADGVVDGEMQRGALLPEDLLAGHHDHLRHEPQ